MKCSRFGARKLTNPLGFSAFGYETANDAEPAAATADEEMADQMANIKVGGGGASGSTKSEASSGGAAGKFRKKEKKKKKKHVM